MSAKFCPWQRSDGRHHLEKLLTPPSSLRTQDGWQQWEREACPVSKAQRSNEAQLPQEEEDRVQPPQQAAGPKLSGWVVPGA